MKHVIEFLKANEDKLVSDILPNILLLVKHAKDKETYIRPDLIASYTGNKTSYFPTMGLKKFSELLKHEQKIITDKYGICTDEFYWFDKQLNAHYHTENAVAGV